MSAATPVLQKERIDLLDSLRGIAILGILLMNMPGFAFPSGDPFVRGEPGSINYSIWYLIRWIPEGTQRALFSMLFGAGIILFMSSKAKQNDLTSASDYFFRRQLWLILFGLINIYIFLWSGDILFDYGCYGLLIFVFRLWSPKKLLIAAGVCFLFMLARENRDLYLDKRTIARGEKIEQIDTTVTKLTAIQKERLSAMQDYKNRSKIENRLKRVERADFLVTSNYENLYDYRVERYFSSFLAYTYFSIWDVLLFMFIGMAFFKLGILTGKAPTKLYAALCVIGLGIGLLVTYYHIQPSIAVKNNGFEYTKSISFEFYEAGRTFRALGLFGLVMLMYKSGIFTWFFKLFRPVGQMAFTNYLTQSIMGAIIFYGIGFGYFGKLERYQAYLVVLSIWTLQIIWSHIWLRYFQYGPFEWVWRQLTYWKKLPLKKQPALPVTNATQIVVESKQNVPAQD